MKCPCRECGKREAGCHGKCPEYREWRKNLEAQKAENRTEIPELSRNVKRHMWRLMLGR